MYSFTSPMACFLHLYKKEEYFINFIWPSIWFYFFHLFYGMQTSDMPHFNPQIQSVYLFRFPEIEWKQNVNYYNGFI